MPEQQQQGTPPCATRDRLVDRVQRHLRRLAELVHAEEAAVAATSTNAYLEIDKAIEAELGEKERAIGALKEHQSEHGC